MGQKVSSDCKEKSRYIAPVPGTHGAPTRKLNHVTVYSDSLHVFLYLPVAAGSTAKDLKRQLHDKYGRSKVIRLFHGGCELADTVLIEEGAEGSKLLLRMQLEDFSTSVDTSLKLDLSNGSARSAPCSGKHSVLLSGTSEHSSACSQPVKRPWEIDFSVYALPEVEGLSASKKKCMLRTIAESGDPNEEDTKKCNIMV